MKAVKKSFLILFACLCILMQPSCVKDGMPASDKVVVKDKTLAKYKVFAENGMLQQSEHLIDVTASFLRLEKEQRQIYLRKKYDVGDVPSSLDEMLVLILEKEVQFLGANIGVYCDVTATTFGKEYKFRICNELSGETICGIDVKDGKKGSFSLSGYIDPNSDGCMQCSATGKLCVCKPLESVFVMNGINIEEGEEEDFSYGDKNVYKVREFPSLRQKVKGPCGHYALFNLLSMAENSKKMSRVDCDCSFMLDRERFEFFLSQWVQELINIRGYVSSSRAISNLEIKKLIKRCVESLYKENVMISFSDINNLDERDANTFTSGSIKERIRDFRENGTPQYFIFSSSDRKRVKGVKLRWDDRMGRKACLDNHWLAMKIEWSEEAQKSPVIISVADSGAIKDNRYAAMIHWYYQVFVQNRM